MTRIKQVRMVWYVCTQQYVYVCDFVYAQVAVKGQLCLETVEQGLDHDDLG